MADTYDLVVIGSGTAAQVASAQVREAGWKVAVIDHRPFGGTCQLRGCDPKKVMVAGEESADGVARMQDHGIDGNVRIDWPALMAFKRGFTDPVPGRQEASYADQGIDAFHGVARFTGADTLQVGGNELRARHFLIAAGASPVPLGIPGVEYARTSDDFLELDALPARVAFIGGGYIAAEFSHLAARAGAHVTVLQRGDRMLPRFDPDLVGWLMKSFTGLGIDIRTNTAAKRIERTADGFVVHADAKGQQIAVAADLVVHTAGRAPDFATLDPAAGNVQLSHGHPVLNEFLQSVSNPRVYAAGDAAGKGPPLTPIASRDAKVVAANLLDGNRHRPDYRAVPSVAFTLPPIAAVGMSEAEARSKGLRMRVNCEKAADWFTAHRINERVYGFKTLVEEDSSRILGAHIVGPHAEEVINIFALAIRQGLSARQLEDTVFAYPTSGSDVAYML
jgi:glutathione reductase (NADPH)